MVEVGGSCVERKNRNFGNLGKLEKCVAWEGRKEIKKRKKEEEL